MTNVTCRLATPGDDFREFQAVQQSAWGDTDLQTIPSHMFVAGANLGNVYGAFGPDGTVYGFTYSMRRGETAYLHMIGVRRDKWNEGIAADLIQANQSYWEEQGASRLTLTFDPLEGANANVYLKNEYNHPGWIRGFYPDYYPDEENSHRFRVEFPFDNTLPERLREQYADPEDTLLAIADDGTVDFGQSLATYNPESEKWEVPSPLPESLAVEFPWDVEKLSETGYTPESPWDNIESQWLDAISGISSSLLSAAKDTPDSHPEYTIIDIDPYDGRTPYDGEEWGAANRYVLVNES